MGFKRFTILFLLPLYLHAQVGYLAPWGKDADLCIHKEAAKPLPRASSDLSKFAEGAILFHQKVISPVDGPRSHFRPTSSRYMQLAIRRYGFFKGYLMGCDRLLREDGDPWLYRTVTIDGTLYKWDPP